MCPLGQFPCGNLSVCLPQPQHCNGQQDCPNGADEENCVDNSGWPHLFDAFMKTRVQESKECMLDVYPDVCHCEGWKVNCNGKNLLHVPAVSSNVTALELNSNRIESLSRDLFIRYRHLERLHLESNNIEMISKRAFSGLISLRKLQPEAFIIHSFIHEKEKGEEGCYNQDGGLIQAEQIHDQRMNFNAP
ncbi:hypothetical protein R3I93_003182 [Phoxinus phoxinus]|uniref:Uncharacterized protein n=1 Tax=Phoxinus phoxinus TaxID=58324 RepID=A0AAN9HEX5_9TELE